MVVQNKERKKRQKEHPSASLANLTHYKAKSSKFIDAPLARKAFYVALEQPIDDILKSLSSEERLSLVRQAIGEKLVEKGLLDLSQYSKASEEGTN